MPVCWFSIIPVCCNSGYSPFWISGFLDFCVSRIVCSAATSAALRRIAPRPLASAGVLPGGFNSENVIGFRLLGIDYLLGNLLIGFCSLQVWVQDHKRPPRGG